MRRRAASHGRGGLHIQTMKIIRSDSEEDDEADNGYEEYGDMCVIWGHNPIASWHGADCEDCFYEH